MEVFDADKFRRILDCLHSPAAAAAVFPGLKPEHVPVLQRRMLAYLRQADCSQEPAQRRVRYLPSQHAPFPDAGRAFAEGGASMQSLRSAIRATCCGNLLWDLDFRSCHPTILGQLAVELQLPCPELLRFNARREAALEEVAALVAPLPWSAERRRKAAKTFTLKLVNSEKYADQRRLPRHSPDWLRSLAAELVSLRAGIAAAHAWALAAVRARGKRHNVRAAAMNLVLCTVERRLLWRLVEFLQSEGATVCVLAHDGCMVRRDGRDWGAPWLLERATAYVAAHEGYTMPLAAKPMDGAIPPALLGASCFLREVIQPTPAALAGIEVEPPYSAPRMRPFTFSAAAHPRAAEAAVREAARAMAAAAAAAAAAEAAAAARGAPLAAKTAAEAAAEAAVEARAAWEATKAAAASPATHLIVRGGMGLGKTHQCLALLRRMRPASLLIVTPRVAFSNSVFATMQEAVPGLAHYQEEGAFDSPWLVCQLESLRRVRPAGQGRWEVARQRWCGMASSAVQPTALTFLCHLYSTLEFLRCTIGHLPNQAILHAPASAVAAELTPASALPSLLPFPGLRCPLTGAMSSFSWMSRSRCSGEDGGEAALADLLRRPAWHVIAPPAVPGPKLCRCPCLLAFSARLVRRPALRH